MATKSQIQAEQYEFPYHYLVDLKREEFTRSLDWGLDYLSYMRQVMELVEKYLRDDVLDVGCGDGYLLYNLAKHTDLLEKRRGVGIDLDGKAIRFARAFSYGLRSITFLEQDISTYEDSFDLITTVETFEHIPDEHIGPFIFHMDRILRPEGHLIVSVPSKVRSVIEKHYRHYDLEMLQNYFPGYTPVEVRYVSARKSLLYQIIARALAHRNVNINFGPFKKILLRLHRQFTEVVSEDRGAHVVAVFRKPG